MGICRKGNEPVFKRCSKLAIAGNKLTLNASKTVYTTFGNYSNSVPNDFKITLNSETIKRDKSCKYLGIVLIII